MSSSIMRTLAALALCAVFAAPSSQAAAQTTSEQELVEKARLTVDAIRRDRDFPALETYLDRAKGVLIVPSAIKAGFIFGGEGGNGVLLSKNAAGEWSYPAFYTLASGSVGLQVGVQEAEVIFVIMTQKGLDQVIKNQFKMGADASMALGPIGAGVGASTTPAFGADIYSFVKARGAFAGGAFEGSLVQKREELNARYYGRPASARDIVFDFKVSNTGADGLRQALARK